MLRVFVGLVAAYPVNVWLVAITTSSTAGISLAQCGRSATGRRTALIPCARAATSAGAIPTMTMPAKQVFITGDDQREAGVRRRV